MIEIDLTYQELSSLHELLTSKAMVNRELAYLQMLAHFSEAIEECKKVREETGSYYLEVQLPETENHFYQGYIEIRNTWSYSEDEGSMPFTILDTSLSNVACYATVLEIHIICYFKGDGIDYSISEIYLRLHLANEWCEENTVYQVSIKKNNITINLSDDRVFSNMSLLLKHAGMFLVVNNDESEKTIKSLEIITK